MTNEQALDMLRRAIDPLQDAVDNVALYMAFDALEKQIPTKPIWDGHCWRCPVCKRGVCGETYCGTCGQALDWRMIDG